MIDAQVDGRPRLLLQYWKPNPLERQSARQESTKKHKRLRRATIGLSAAVIAIARACSRAPVTTLAIRSVSDRRILRSRRL